MLALLKIVLKFSYCFVLAFIFSGLATAQVKPTPAQERMNSVEQRHKLEQRSILNDVKFRSIGPSIMSGRVVDVDADPEDATEFYVAYATGGLRHATNNGHSFILVLDIVDVLCIGEIEVKWNSSSGAIWVGTGVGNNSRSSYAD